METKREFSGTSNVWVKRIGLLLVIVGLFPEIALKYWDKFELVWKFLIVSFVISYVIYLIKSFIKDIFNPFKE